MERLSAVTWGQEWGGIYYKGAEEGFRDDGNGLYFDYGGVYRGLFICQDSILKMGMFYRIVKNYKTETSD